MREPINLIQGVFGRKEPQEQVCIKYFDIF